MNDKNLHGYQARTYKRVKNNAQGFDKKEFMQDIQFLSNPSKNAKKFEEKQKIKEIKDQINYFGYQIEPFHMKNERETGNFDQEGHFIFDKKKDKKINDAWLDSLEKDNELDQYKESYNENILKRIRKIDEKKDGFQKQKATYGNNNLGQGFFKSRRFQTPEEAEKYYQNLQQEEQTQRNDLNEEEEIDEIQKQSSDNEQNMEEYQSSKSKSDKQQKQNAIDKLWNLDIQQLKLILFDLLDDQKTSNETIKRLREQLIQTNKNKQNFKKNVRKSKIIEEKNQVDQLTEEQKLEIKETCDLIVDICHIIMSKTDDPCNTIYSVKKDDLIPQNEVKAVKVAFDPEADIEIPVQKTAVQKMQINDNDSDEDNIF